ncbi:MAG: PAS domain S-box protein [Rivularia sp. (in: Bacteria)]|nr:PAS domain S-box protein [Rivularia sp. MS3]
MVQQLRVLIVDNCSEDSQKYESYLQKNSQCEYTIFSESTGNAALDLYQSLYPDLILLEYLLPDMDGLEFLAQLKQKQDREVPPVIMITGCGNENIAVRAIKSGFQDYLVKEQVTAELLKSTINSAIANSKKVEKNWCCSDELFRTSVENMLDSFGIFSSIRDEADNIVDFRIDYINAAACECNQMTKEEQLGKKLCEIFPSHRTTGLFEEYCQVVKTNKPLVKESLIYTDVFGKQELTRAFDIRAAKLRDGFVASWRDVTENKQAEKRLQDSEQLLERISSTTPGLVYVYDLVEQRSVYVNHQVGELLGYSKAEIQKMGSNAIPHLMHPDDLTRLPTLFQRFNTISDDDIVETEYRLRHADGSWHWFYSWDTVFTRNPDGSARQLIGTALDITNRKQIQEELWLTNERFQLASRAVDSVIYDWDITFNSVIRTEGITTILGYSLEEVEPTIEWWMQLVHPEDKNNLFQPLQAVIANQDYYTFEYRVRHKDGQYCYVLDKGLVVRNSEYQPIRVVGSMTDITKRKQAQIALSESEAKYKRIIQSNIIGIYFGDFTGRIYEANDAFLEIVGYNRQDLEAGLLNWNQMTLGTESQAMIPRVKKELESNGLCTPFEKQYIRKDGTRVSVLMAIACIEGRESEGYSVCFVLDITKRKQAQLELSESEAKCRRIIESNIVGIYFGDFTGKIYEANDSFLRTFGYSREELNNGSLYWNRMTPPEYSELDERKIQELQTDGICKPFEKEYLAKDGTRIPILLAIATIKARETEGYSVCLVLDISQRKQAQLELRESEQRYRFLSESIPQIVWSCNPQGECEYISQRWVEYTGKSFAEARNFGWLDIVHPEDAESIIHIWQQSLENGELYEAEMRYRRSDGMYRWFLVRALPITDEQGQVLKWFGTSTDIHERKQLEAIHSELLRREQTARTEAETANKAKDEFVAMVSHDLRSPLNSILGWAKLLRTYQLDETTTTRALETIERNAKSQAKLLEDLLDTSRILRGTIQLDKSQINLIETVQTAIETSYPAANIKSIYIESIIDNSLPLIEADSERLQQVLGNLLSNAIKFTPEEGQIRVELSMEEVVRGREGEEKTRKQEELSFLTSSDLNSSRYIRITVSDTGIGISPKFLPYVFERYRQAEGIGKKGGLGLGLTISRHIIELHGGTIEVFSRGEGEGSTFTIKLPI